MAGNFIAMVYATLKEAGIDTSGMSTDDAVAKFEELNGSKGKSNNSGITPAEQKRLEELGIHNNKTNADSQLSAEEKRLEQLGISDLTKDRPSAKINIEPRELRDLPKLKEILSSADLEEKIQKSKFAYFSKGREDLIIKPIIDDLGFSRLPQKVDAKTYEAMKSNHIVLNRGLTKSEYVEDFYNGDMFVGLGVNGSGIYTTDIKKKAEGYAGEDGAVAEMLLDKNAKVGIGLEVAREAKELLFSLQSGTDISGNQIDIGLDTEKMIKIGEGINRRLNTLVALSKGYDALDMGNGDYLVLNRSAVIIKGE